MQALGLTAVSPGGTWETIPTGGKSRRSSTGATRKPAAEQGATAHVSRAIVAEAGPKRAGAQPHKAPAQPQHQDSPPPSHQPRQHIRAVPVSTGPAGNARVRASLPSHHSKTSSGRLHPLEHEGAAGAVEPLQTVHAARYTDRGRTRVPAGWLTAWTEPSLLADSVRGAVAQRGLPGVGPSAAHGAAPRPCSGCLASWQASRNWRPVLRQETGPSGVSWHVVSLCHKCCLLLVFSRLSTIPSHRVIP